MIHRSAQAILATLVLVGLLSVISFWWIGMHNGSGHNCLAARIQTTDCQNATTAETASYHLNTLRSFTTNILPALSVSVIFLALAWLTVVGLSNGIQRLSRQFFRRDDNRAISPPGEYQHWISLLEHSPSTP